MLTGLGAAATTRNVAGGFAALSLYATATVITRSNGLLTLLHRSYYRYAALHYPLPPDRFLVVMVRKWLITAGAVGFAALAVFSAAALDRELLGDKWPLILFAAALQWLLVASLAVTLTWRPPWLPPRVLQLVMALHLPAFAAVYAPNWLAPVFPFARFLPGGWVAAAMWSTLGGGTWVWWLLPVLGTGALSVTGWRRLSATYSDPALDEMLQSPDSVVALDEEAGDIPVEDTLTEDGLAEWQKVREGMAREVGRAGILEGRVGESSQSSQAGPLDRAASRCLTPRELVLMELLLGGRPSGYTAAWKISALTIAGSALLAVLLPATRGFALVAVVIGCGLGAPLMGGRWIGFHASMTGERVMPVYACFPVGYWELSRLIFKVSALRFAAWLPLVAGAGAAFGTPGSAAGTATALEVAMIAIMLQPFMVAGHFAYVSDFTKRVNWQKLVLTGMGFLLLVGVAVGGVIVFNAPTLLSKMIALLALCGLSFFFWASYGLLQECGRVDLLAAPRDVFLG
ncbi:MAG: hypothetical protein HYX28_04825 [Candidatus Koribacter versatilis]|uniref:Uncharacterized protein n=1 Tax=Candidatus Korobacter versatilis TaxID=658062 RepID=A0A932A7W0_9BACT|nr:hypothetical protein [Candidatus Koribacter versatilis]